MPTPEICRHTRVQKALKIKGFSHLNIRRDEMLKEQVAKLDYKWRFCGIPDEYETEWENEGEIAKQNCRAFAKEVIDLFKAEVDKLTVIDDEEIKFQVKKCEYPISKAGQEPDGEIAFMACNTARLYKELPNAQLQADKDKLLDLMGE